MAEAYRLKVLGISISLEDYEQRLPAVVRDDLYQIATELKVT